MEELIQVVDDDDKPVRGATKQEVWEKGLRHRIVRLVVEDKNGNVLLQKRTPTMQLWPGRWDNSASGHVDNNEDYDQAIQRELQEELGLSGLPLQEVAYYQTNSTFEWRKLKRFIKIYRVVIDRDTKLSPGAGEISETRWFSPSEIEYLIRDHPDQITDGLIEIYERIIKHENHGH